MSISALFNRWNKTNILVAGDFMLDTYTFGSVNRVSPEAPVMVVHASKEEQLPGGAGNVVLNLASLGAKVTALGRVGDDSTKDDLFKKLKSEKVNTASLYVQKGYRTPIKNRILASGQQIVRVDFEEKLPLIKSLEDKIILDIPKILKTVSVVAISDYDKGFLTDKVLRALIDEAIKLEIPVIVDPKGKDFSKYSGAFLIKPNFKEAIAAANFDEHTDLEVVANEIHQQTNIPNIMITRSSSGISLFSNNKREDFSVKVKEVNDVTGAGDTVLAVLTFAISNNIPLSQAVVLCNLAAGQVIEHLGCARISIKELAELILSQHLDNKVFSEKYLRVLQFILDHEDFVLLKISITDQVSPKLFTQIKNLSNEYSNCKLVLYLESEPHDQAIIELLASLVEVNFIIKKVSNLQKFCEKHAPKKIFDFVQNELEQKKSLAHMI